MFCVVVIVKFCTGQGSDIGTLGGVKFHKVLTTAMGVLHELYLVKFEFQMSVDGISYIHNNP